MSAAERKLADRQNSAFTEEELTAASGALGEKHMMILRAAQVDPSYAIIGATLELKIGTVRSRLSRARTILNALLAKHESLNNRSAP